MQLAAAPTSASANDIAEWLLLTIGTVLIVAVAAGLVVQLAKRRRRRQLEVITAAVVVWGIIAAASVSYFFMRKMDWNNELQQKIYGGLYDSTDTADRPNAPMSLWSVLGLCYVAMIGWTAAGATSIQNNSSRTDKQHR